MSPVGTSRYSDADHQNPMPEAAPNETNCRYINVRERRRARRDKIGFHTSMHLHNHYAHQARSRCRGHRSKLYLHIASEQWSGEDLPLAPAPEGG